MFAATPGGEPKLAAPFGGSPALAGKGVYFRWRSHRGFCRFAAKCTPSAFGSSPGGGAEAFVGDRSLGGEPKLAAPFGVANELIS